MGFRPLRKEAMLRPRFLFSALVAAVATLVFAGSASAQSIQNQTSTGGQTNWLETFATGAETSNSTNMGRITVLVEHPAGRSVTGLKIDDNYDGTDNTATVGTTNVAGVQKPNVNGGYTYSRVTFQYQVPTGNTGMSCPIIGTRTRRTVRPIRIRAVLDNGTTTPSTSSDIKFVANGQCLASEDFPFIYQRSQTATSINTGDSVTFTYRGDDPDITGNADFQGIRWRARRLSDGATTALQTSCPGNGDNADKTLTVNFPNRGRWVVEAELLNGGGCGTNDNSGYWWYIGAVDVNSPASESPAVNLTATRPQINGNTTITAAVDDAEDSGQGGQVEAIEWDLDENTGNGVNGYEDVGIADWPNGISAAQRTRTINTTGKSPGLHTVRARVGDNGALGGADNIRRTNTDTVTYLVDTPPVVNDQSVATETQTALLVNFNGTDVDNDPLTYTITDSPDNGSLSGSGASRTYTPNAGFAGVDQFTVQASDGFGGTDTAVITVRVDPDTTIDAGPTGTLDDRSASFDFSSRATDATFECSLDGAAFTTCASGQSYTDLDDGEHTFRVRALAAGNTDQSPASRTWTVDAFPVVTIDSGPDAETANTSATFAFQASETGATVAPTTDCKLDGGEFRPCSSPYTYNDLDDGSHTFTVRATDAYGKTGTDDYTWAIDAVGSNTLITDAPDPVVASTDAHLEFESPDGDATFQCSLDGAPFTACDSPEDYPGLTEGGHNFRVRAIDAANIADPTPAQASWRVDLTAPTTSITAGPNGLTTDKTPTFEFTAGANEIGTTYECQVDAGAWVNNCASPFTAGELSDGEHTFRVRATDAVGNAEDPGASRTFTVDTTPPGTEILTGPAEGARVSSTTAVFEFDSSAADAAEFLCRLDGSPWAPCDSDSDQTYMGLADGDHTFSVRARDAAGNDDPSPPSRSWTVDATPPQTVIAAGPSGTVRSTSAKFEIQSDDSEADLECSLDGAAFQGCAADQEFTGLSDGPHVLLARAVDALGNADPTPASREWTVDTSTEAPPKEAEPRKKRKCTFERDLPRCGEPYMRARAAAARPAAGDSSFGKVVLKANGGGSPLGSASFKLPFGLGLRALDGEGRIGAIELFGFGKRRTIPIEAGDGTVSGRNVTLEGLPAKVRRLRVALTSPSLRVTTAICGTKEWKATLGDQAGNLRKVKTNADIRCPKGAGK